MKGGGLVCLCLVLIVGSALCSPAVGGEAVRRVKKPKTAAPKATPPVASVDAEEALSSSSFDTTSALIKTAKALARSHSTSEVLTLNLTNLLILVVLKAIIFGIGLFYFGGVSFKGGHDHGWGRSLDKKSSSPFPPTSNWMSQGELLLMLTYVLGSTNDNFDCMYRVACEDPGKAKDYLNASNMLLKGAKYAKKFISYNPKYEDVVRGLHEAVSHKKNGGDCRARYVCAEVPSL